VVLMKNSQRIQLSPQTKMTKKLFKYTWNFLLVLSVLYMISHITDALYYYNAGSLDSKDWNEVNSLEKVMKLPDEKNKLAKVVLQILKEDKIPQAEIWALAIAKYTPSDNLGYIALVLAQIRRESHFNTFDLEWLYDRIVPDVLHEMGFVTNHINTIGPMQINRNQLLKLLQQSNEKVKLPSGPNFYKLTSSIEYGVKYSIYYLDQIVVKYIKDRKIYGSLDYPGQMGLALDNELNQVPIKDKKIFQLRQATAAYQKMLSDLLGSPLSLDGYPGKKTVKASNRYILQFFPNQQELLIESINQFSNIKSAKVFQENFCFQTIAQRWADVYGSIPKLSIYPRISYDPRLVYIMTDFNIGNNTCKVAAMQYQLQILLNDPNLVADGKLGTKTMTAMSTFIQKRKMNEKRKGQFLELIKTKKKGLWLRQQVQQMIIKDWKQKFAVLPATALSPNIHNKYYNQQKQSLKTISTIDYISTSVQFFENYYLRINRKYSELTEKK
jgi:hypothetical protein